MIERRGKQQEKHKAHIKSKDFYKFYSLQYFKEYINGNKRATLYKDSEYYISYSKYCKVIDEVNIAIRKVILEDNFDFNMPYRMGLLTIRKHKSKPYLDEEGNLVNTLPVDWNSTLKLWEEDPNSRIKKTLVRHYNEHTKGYIAKWFYSVRQANFRYKSGYRFIPCRTSKLELAKILKDENNKIDYYLL